MEIDRDRDVTVMFQKQQRWRWRRQIQKHYEWQKIVNRVRKQHIASQAVLRINERMFICLRLLKCIKWLENVKTKWLDATKTTIYHQYQQQQQQQ